MVRLEPFDDAQIGVWLGIWNENNAAYFRERALQPLDPMLAKAQGPLAEQPLLLLMLALYDADENALRSAARLRQVELYERLIRKFVEREVMKFHPKDRIAPLVEQEMHQLSYVAFSMFNRGRQWTTGEEFDRDLNGLKLASTLERETEFAAPLSTGDLTPGKFFFMHEARATRDGQVLQTFEFLHATFGEFLIARLLAFLLDDLMQQQQGAVRREIDDRLIRALLSWAVLSTRSPILSFLRELTERDGRNWRPVQSVQLLRRLDTREDSYPEYRPSMAGPQRRYAHCSANLLLITLACGGTHRASAVMPGSEDTITQWQRYAFLWRSQCSAEEWRSLVDTIFVKTESVSIELELAPVSERIASSSNIGHPHKILWGEDVLWMREEAVFSYQADVNTLVEAVAPLLPENGERIVAFGDALRRLMEVLTLPRTADLARMVETYCAAIEEWNSYPDPLVTAMLGHLAGLPGETAGELMRQVSATTESAADFIAMIETVRSGTRGMTIAQQPPNMSMDGSRID